MLSTAMVATAAKAQPALAAPAAGAAEGVAQALQGPTVTGSAERSSMLRFDVAAGPLDGVFAEFERITAVRVVVADPGVRALQSLGVAGNFTPEQAMAQLLRGLGVRASFDGMNVTVSLLGVAEFVQVEGRTPPLQSPKYRDAVREVPQTIVVIPQQIFGSQNATSLREVLRNTPGITMSIGEGASGTVAAGDQIMIRGFNARNDIYIDGARDAGEVSRDMFNTESVEVAKGPTSATGGRSATGGSINLVTKTPGPLDSASFRMTLGSADHQRATFDVNRRVSQMMSIRLNGMWQDTGYPGRDVQLNRSWGVAPSVSLGFGPSTQVVASYSRVKQNNIPDLGIPTLFPDTAIARGLTVNDLDFSNWYGIASRDHEKTTSDIGTVIVDHRFNNALKVRNLTRYGRNFRDGVITPPRPASTTAGQGPEDPGYNPAVPQMRRTDTKYQWRTDRVTTNQTDLSAAFQTGRIGHRTDVGLEFARDHQPTLTLVDLFTNGRPPVVDLLNPDPFVTYRAAIAPNGASSDARAKGTAIYAFDTVRINPQWQADLGLRYDHIKIDYRTVSATGMIADFGRTDDAVSGRAGLVFKPVQPGTIYAAYSTSFVPSYEGAHGLQVAATGANSQALPPERSRNIEVGVKWDFALNLSATAAVFDMEKTNAKTVDTSGTTVLTGNQRVRGVELGISGNITPRWGAFGGVALMNGVVRDSAVATEIDQKLAYVPHMSLNLWSTYQLPGNVTVGGGGNYSDGHFFNQTGGFLFVSNRFDTRYVQNAAAVQNLTSYWVFNAVAQYPLNRHVQLQVNLNNVTNERYADRAYDRHFLPGPARQILVSPVITF